MVVTMLQFWITLSISVLGSNAAGEFSVLHSPESLTFSGTSKTLESLLKEIYSASLGLSVEENSEWDGLFITDPFNTPEAVVEVYIEGISTLGEASGLKSKKYALDIDEYESDAYEAVKHRIEQRFVNGGNKLVNIRLNDPNDLTAVSKVFGTINPKIKQSQKFIHESIDENYQFLYEIEVLNELTNKIKSGAVSADNKVDFYYIRFRSLHALSDFHGPNSVLTKEAKKLLAQALQALSDAFVQAYGGSVLVTAVTIDVEHTRRVREFSALDVLYYLSGEYLPPTTRATTTTKATPAPARPRPSNDNYTADYAAIFNIILWFVIALVFSLLAIVYSFMDMDPGRDSIIYRMTSTRMKKDN